MAFTTHGWYDKEGNYLQDQKNGMQYWFISNKEHWESIFKNKNNDNRKSKNK